MAATTNNDEMMFKCELCISSFKYKSNLTKHQRQKHNLPPPSSKKKFSCKYCESAYNYQRNLVQHIRLKHEKPMFICDICRAVYNSKRHLRKHMRETHESCIDNQDADVSRGNAHTRKVICALCKEENSNYKAFRNHVENSHNMPLNIHQLQLQNFDEFECWKENLEKEEKTRFVRQTVPARRPDGTVKYYYRCNRDGFPKVRSGYRVRGTKSQGSNKIGGACSAFMEAKKYMNGQISVAYSTVHLHKTTLAHLPLLKTDRNSIARKLQEGVKVEYIIDEIRNSSKSLAENADSERLQSLARHDIYNIIRDYKIRYTKLEENLNDNGQINDHNFNEEMVQRHQEEEQINRFHEVDYDTGNAQDEVIVDDLMTSLFGTTTDTNNQNKQEINSLLHVLMQLNTRSNYSSQQFNSVKCNLLNAITILNSCQENNKGMHYH